MTSPTQRSLKYLRELGFTATVTEHYNRFARRRIDLFGFLDIACLDGEPGVLGVQTTTGDHVAERVAKILALPVAELWLARGNRIHVHGWAKRGARGTRKVWTLREMRITRADFPSDHPGANLEQRETHGDGPQGRREAREET